MTHHEPLENWLESMRNLQPMDPRPLRKKECGECAVTCGYYREYSDALKLAPADEQLARSQGWPCHVTPGLACKGNADNLGLDW